MLATRCLFSIVGFQSSKDSSKTATNFVAMLALNDPVGTASTSSTMDELPQEFPKVEVIDTLTIDVVPSTSTTSTRVAMHDLPDGLPKVPTEVSQARVYYLTTNHRLTLILRKWSSTSRRDFGSGMPWALGSANMATTSTYTST